LKARLAESAKPNFASDLNAFIAKSQCEKVVIGSQGGEMAAEVEKLTKKRWRDRASQGLK